MIANEQAIANSLNQEQCREFVQTHVKSTCSQFAEDFIEHLVQKVGVRQTADGKCARYRRDAQIQSKCGAETEHRRLLVELSNTGTLKRSPERTAPTDKPPRPTFADAVRRFKTTRLATLKPSTRITYTERLKTMLIPRFGHVPLDELKGEALAKFDSELARDGLAPSTRRNFHIVFRSARHSDLKTTQRYADLDANDLRAAIDLLQVDGNRGNGPALTEQFGLKHNQVTR